MRVCSVWRFRLAVGSAIAIVFVVLAGLASVGAAPQGSPENGAPVALSVDASRTGPTLNRHLFGQFAEHLGKGVYEGVWVGPDSSIPNTRGIRNDVVAALKAIKVPNVRWPGGCFADEYHWRKGIGPLKDRPATLNPKGALQQLVTAFCEISIAGPMVTLQDLQDILHLLTNDHGPIE